MKFDRGKAQSNPLEGKEPSYPGHAVMNFKLATVLIRKMFECHQG